MLTLINNMVKSVSPALGEQAEGIFWAKVLTQSALFCEYEVTDSGRKKKLRGALLRWHPDKWLNFG